MDKSWRTVEGNFDSKRRQRDQRVIWLWLRSRSALFCFLISSPMVEAYCFHTVRYNIKHDSFCNSIATAFESKNKKFTLRISNKGTKEPPPPPGGSFIWKRRGCLQGISSFQAFRWKSAAVSGVSGERTRGKRCFFFVNFSPALRLSESLKIRIADVVNR